MIENHHGEDGEEYAVEYPEYGEGCLLQCDCSAECYREDRSVRQHCGDFGERVCTGLDTEARRALGGCPLYP